MTQNSESPAKPVPPASEPPVLGVAPPQSKTEDSADKPALPPEFGGRKGPEATRYGDWEMNGKCVDF